MHLVRFSALLLLLLAGAAFAQTAGGTSITNQAEATFTDANGVAQSALSNEVVTVVDTVYDFTITPDAGVNPSGANAADNDFSSTVDGLNDLNAPAGSTVDFVYTLTNNTNGDDTIDLAAEQAASGSYGSNADDLDLTGVAIYVWDDSVAGGGNGDGLVDAGELTLVPAAGLAMTQGESVQIVVRATIPGGAAADSVALLDLQGTSQGDTSVFENNNLARATTENAAVGIAKDVTSLSYDGATGRYTVVYTLTVENFGSVALNGLQITDDLDTTFRTATASEAASIVSVNVASATLGTVGTGYDGSDDELLDGTDTLAAGATATVTLTVVIDPGASYFGSFDNSATVTATSPGGVPQSDTSTDGTDPDPNDDGDPGDDPEDTSVTPLELPVIGLAKDLASVVQTDADSGDGDGLGYRLVFTLTVANLGGVDLDGVQVTDDLAATFSGHTIDAVVIGASGLTAASGYDGSTDALLAGTDTLTAGSTGTITLTVDVTVAGTGAVNLTNSATASGTGPEGATVTDTSTDGTDVDPDADPNGDPTDDSTPTPIALNALALVKQQAVCADATCSAGGPSFGSGDLTVEPGQYIVYRITAANQSSTAAVSDVVIGDVIPVPTEYAASSLATSGIECNTGSVASPSWGSCPASGTSSGVVSVRLVPSSALAASSTVTLTFVVLVP